MSKKLWKLALKWTFFIAIQMKNGRSFIKRPFEIKTFSFFRPFENRVFKIKPGLISRGYGTNCFAAFINALLILGYVHLLYTRRRFGVFLNLHFSRKFLHFKTGLVDLQFRFSSKKNCKLGKNCGKKWQPLQLVAFFFASKLKNVPKLWKLAL